MSVIAFHFLCMQDGTGVEKKQKYTRQCFLIGYGHLVSFWLPPPPKYIDIDQSSSFFWAVRGSTVSACHQYRKDWLSWIQISSRALYHVCARAPICKSALSPELVLRIKFHMNTRSKLTVTVPTMSAVCYNRFYFINSFLNAFSDRADGAKL